MIEEPDILVSPTEEMVAAAASAVELLESVAGEEVGLLAAHQAVSVPDALLTPIRRLCRYLSEGKRVTIVPYPSELTTQAAANLLGISRTRLIELIDRGELKVRRQGAPGRLRTDDVLAFRDIRAKRQQDAQSRIDELVASTEDTSLSDATPLSDDTELSTEQ
ncbi:MAG TPA: helix-turn-helix domain-containing protein [Candidatus Sulfotelmatobacter sp.]|nr:helix-turn-helix domain-containing protein [Candidatus Sulfotelmatobacter sp.]